MIKPFSTDKSIRFDYKLGGSALHYLNDYPKKLSERKNE